MLPLLAIVAIISTIFLAAGSALAQTEPTAKATAIKITQPADQQPGKPVSVSAQLTDASGANLGGFPLKLYVLTEPFGPRLMKVAEATTGSDGVATFSFTPTWVGDIKVTVLFAGTKDFAATQSNSQLKAVGPVTLHRNADFGLESIREWAPTVVALLVAAIWSTFIVVVVRLVFAIRSDDAEATPNAPGAKG